MAHEDLLNRVMNDGLREWLVDQSGVRDAAQKEQVKRFGLGMGGAVVISLAILFFANEIQVGVAAAAGLGILAWQWALRPVRRVSGDIKLRINQELASRLSLTFSPSGGPNSDYQLATQFGLLPSSFDKSDYTDFWTGQFGASEGQLFEAHLQEYQSSGKHRRLETIFRGVIIGYAFARPFSSTTLVLPDKGMFNGLTKLGHQFSGLKLEPVKMVDPDFERRFEVYSNDQVEARYVLHPAFCERLNALGAAFNSSRLRLVFVEGRVIVVMETDDQFESGGIDAAGDEARIGATIDQIGSLIDLTEALNERPRATFARPV